MNLKRRFPKIFNRSSKNRSKSRGRSKNKKTIKNKNKSTSSWSIKSILRVLSLLLGVLVAVVAIHRIFLEGLYNITEVQNVKFQNIVEIDGRESSAVWNEEEKINILMVGVDYRESGHKQISTLVIMQLYPETGENVLMYVPLDTYVDTDEYGTVPLKNLIIMGDFEAQDSGYSYAFETIEEKSALKFDRYFFYDTSILEDLMVLKGGVTIRLPSEITVEDQSNKFQVAAFDENRVKLNSNSVLAYIDDVSGGEGARQERQTLFFEGFVNSWSFLDIWRMGNIADLLGEKTFSDMSSQEFVAVSKYLYRSKNALDTRLIETLDLEETITTEGEKVNLYGGLPLWEIWRENLLNDQVALELARVEVFNGSDIFRAASKYSSMMRNEGVDVIRINNAPTDSKDSYLYVQDEDRSYYYTISAIQKIFGEELEVVVGKTDFLSTGDLVVILGNDLD